MAGRDFHGVRHSLDSLITLTKCAFVLRNALQVYDMESVTLTKQGAYSKWGCDVELPGYGLICDFLQFVGSWPSRKTSERRYW